jgi:UDP-N-acetylmuramate dehydrogenase
MGLPELAHALAAIEGVDARVEEPLAHHTPLRVGGPVELWVVVHSVDALKDVLRLIRAHSLGFKVHWPFQDWIVRDGGLAGVVVRPGRGFEGLSTEPERPGAVRLGAATPFGALRAVTSAGPLAALAQWPGTAGALIQDGNTTLLDGTCSELRWWSGRSIHTEKIAPGTPLPTVPPSAILVDLCLENNGQPSKLLRRPPPRPGALFDAPDGGKAAGELDRSHLGGARLRSWRLSEVEPGVAVNLGGGTAKDLLLLMQGVQARVESERGVSLKARLPVVGAEPGRRER